MAKRKCGVVRAMKQEKKIYDNSFFWGALALVWQGLFFYMPLSFLLTTSVVKYALSTNNSYFTFDHYKALFDPVYGYIILRSLLAASCTVLVTLIIAYPVAYYLALKVTRWKSVLFALLILPFWTNFLLLVYSWYFLLENDGIINMILLKLGLITTPLHLMNTTGAIYFGMFYCYLPFMLLPLYSSLEKLNPRLLEASADLGASFWQTFRNIIIPLTSSGIKTGAVLVFVPAFGEFVIPALLGGDKTMYVGTVITHYFLTMRNVPLGSAFTCMSAVVLVFFLLVIFKIARFLFQGKNHGA